MGVFTIHQYIKGQGDSARPFFRHLTELGSSYRSKSYFISSHRDESSWPLVDCTNIFTNNLFIARVEENHVCQFYKICSGDHEPGQHPYHLQAYLHLAQPKRGLLART